MKDGTSRTSAPANARQSAPVVLILAAALLACSSDPATPTGAGGAGGAGGTGGGEPLGCPVAIQWADGPELPGGRDHHVTFVAESAAGVHLYVNGGTNYQATLSDTWMAPIAPDGSVGAWTETTPMPSARAGHGLVVTGGHVYTFGGRRIQGGLIDLSEVMVASLGDDGHIGAWIEATPLPATRFHSYAAFAEGRVFVTGGLGEEGVSSDSVYSAELGDGSVSAWQIATLSRPRSHHVSLIWDGHLYVIGGLDGNPAGSHEPLADIERAAVLSNGELGPWEQLGELDETMATGSIVQRGGCALLSGGIEDASQHSNRVRAASLTDDAGLGAFLDITPLPFARSHVHQAPAHGQQIYYVGGSIGLQDVTPTVAIGTFVDPEGG